MDRKDDTGLGRQTRETVTRALDLIDLSGVSRMVDSALDDVRRCYDNIARPVKAKRPSFKAQRPSVKAVRIPIRRPGKLGGVLGALFGGIGLCVSLFVLCASLLGTLAFTPSLPVLLLLTACELIPVAAFGTLLHASNTLLGRDARLTQYVRLAGDKAYCTIASLAQALHKPERFIIKDLSQMIARGYLPEGHLDAQQTSVMFNNETYALYRQTQEALLERERQAVQTPPPAPAASAEAGAVPADAPLASLLSEGEQYRAQIGAAGQALADSPIAPTLAALDAVLQSIFSAIQKYPGQMDELQRFMEYYLPTTLRLVEAYREFHLAPIQGENIRSAKAEIARALETINGAFARLLDGLYQDAAFDAEADAAVLRAMLAKDGLTGSDFTREEEKP